VSSGANICGFSLHLRLKGGGASRGRGLSLWRYSVETVIVSFVRREELTTSSAFRFSRALEGAWLRGGGAYLCGFTPWKQLSFPLSTMKN